MKIDYSIRPIKENEITQLENFLYEAIFVPEGMEAPPRSILQQPDLQVYLSGFGTEQADTCLVAEVEEQIVGAVWARIMDDYGHIDDATPSLAISLYPEYRHAGIGTMLMKKMLQTLQQNGYKQVSLAVQQANYALKMYKNVGFYIVGQNEEEYIMKCEL